jgi:hypothetical protein
MLRAAASTTRTPSLLKLTMRADLIMPDLIMPDLIVPDLVVPGL